VTPDTSADAGRSLVDAARTLLAEEGPDALTVRRIAEQAGCSTMVVYSRMGGKAGVIDALYQEGFANLGAAIRAGRSTDDPIADLRNCGRRYRKWALENPTYYAVMFEAGVPDFEPSLESKSMAADTLRALADKVQRATDAGQLPAGNPVEIAACLWSANHGVVSLELKGIGPPDIDWSRRYTQVVDAMLAGLRV
jgi:AcrR family transcriptional regulator